MFNGLRHIEPYVTNKPYITSKFLFYTTVSEKTSPPIRPIGTHLTTSRPSQGDLTSLPTRGMCNDTY